MTRGSQSAGVARTSSSSVPGRPSRSSLASSSSKTRISLSGLESPPKDRGSLSEVPVVQEEESEGGSATSRSSSPHPLSRSLGSGSSQKRVGIAEQPAIEASPSKSRLSVSRLGSQSGSPIPVPPQEGGGRISQGSLGVANDRDELSATQPGFPSAATGVGDGGEVAQQGSVMHFGTFVNGTIAEGDEVDVDQL